MARISSPSQRDIARIANVSQAAVSMVLNGLAEANGIPLATQERIRAAIVASGYVPNVAARSLRGGRNGLIGVHTFERVFPVTPDDYYHEFLVGIEEQAVKSGQDLVLFASTQQPDGTRTIYGAGSNRLRLADGAVILGIEKNDEELERLASEGFPFVFIGRRDVAGSSIPYVAIDYAGAVEAIVRQLAEYSHKIVAYVGSTLRSGPQEERFSGFCTSMADTGLTGVGPLFCDPEALTGDWLTGLVADGTTAIVVETYELAKEVNDLATAAGIAIPAMLSMVCLDVGPRATAAGPWSHIEVPRRELGRRAVALLVGILDGTLAPDHTEVLTCEPATPGTIAQAQDALELMPPAAEVG